MGGEVINGAFVRFICDQVDAVVEAGAGTVPRDLACEIVAAQLMAAHKRGQAVAAAEQQVERVMRGLRSSGGGSQ